MRCESLSPPREFVITLDLPEPKDLGVVGIVDRHLVTGGQVVDERREDAEVLARPSSRAALLEQGAQTIGGAHRGIGVDAGLRAETDDVAAAEFVVLLRRRSPDDPYRSPPVVHVGNRRGRSRPEVREVIASGANSAIIAAVVSARPPRSQTSTKARP